jgi:hypothetical protein
MKHLLLSVNCANENPSEYSEFFLITLSAEHIRRIKELSALVKNMKLTAVEEIDNSGHWASVDALMIANVPEHALHTLVDMFEKDNDTMEYQKVRVTADKFQFVSVPKHHDDDMLLRTNSVCISELDHLSAYIDLK